MLGIVAGASIVTVWLLGSRRGKLLARLRAFYYARTAPNLQRTPTGPLSQQALQVLQATTLVLVDTPVEMSHYSTFFQWQSENLPGYRDLYEEFALTLNQAGRRAAQRPFAECDIAVKQNILTKVDLDRGRWAALAKGVFDRNWLRFEMYIVRQILTLFVRTDGWVLLGYESWPGTPRGLDRYTKPPATRLEAA
jgi:hypothetical protein